MNPCSIGLFSHSLCYFFVLTLYKQAIAIISLIRVVVIESMLDHSYKSLIKFYKNKLKAKIACLIFPIRTFITQRTGISLLMKCVISDIYVYI